MRVLAASTLVLFALISMTACGESSPGKTATGVPVSASGSATPKVSAEPTALAVVGLAYRGGELQVEVASTAEARAQGLSGRSELAPDAGMLFDLGEESQPFFWMKDMRFPLDIVWIDAERRVVGVSEAAAPAPGTRDADLAHYSPERAVRYVLEINRGDATRRGLSPGVALTFTLP